MATTISIVIPVKDEAANIENLARELETANQERDWQWEAIWIDDGSSDGSLKILQMLAETSPHHKYLSFEQNAGQSAAFWAGFQYARGDIIATMDGDGQNDPADIGRLIEIIQSGRADMVNGYRQFRRDNWIRRVASKIANGFRNLMTGRTVRDVGCSTRAFRKECVQDLPQFKGMHRFLPTLVQLNGYRLHEVPVNHRPRIYGRTKYTINNRLWAGMFDLFGVFWLKHRKFLYKINTQADN